MGHSKRLWDKLLGEISRYKPEGITTNTPRKECQARSKRRLCRCQRNRYNKNFRSCWPKRFVDWQRMTMTAKADFVFAVDLTMPTKYQTPFAKSKLLAITCGWLVCLFVADATAVAQQYPGIKCIIDGHHQCQIRYSVEFGQGTIYFASQNAVSYTHLTLPTICSV